MSREIIDYFDRALATDRELQMLMAERERLHLRKRSFVERQIVEHVRWSARNNPDMSRLCQDRDNLRAALSSRLST